jgi:hypothetical protein
MKRNVFVEMLDNGVRIHALSEDAQTTLIDHTFTTDNVLTSEQFKSLVNIAEENWLIADAFKRSVQLCVHWGNVTKEIIDGLTNYIGTRKVAELGCGPGYFLSCLKENKVDIKGFDLGIESGEPEGWLGSKLRSKKKYHLFSSYVSCDYNETSFDYYDVILMVWPRNADKALLNMKSGQILILIGELDGCTGGPLQERILEEKFELLEERFLEKHFVRWPGNHDRIDIYRKK